MQSYFPDRLDTVMHKKGFEIRQFFALHGVRATNHIANFFVSNIWPAVRLPDNIDIIRVTNRVFMQQQWVRVYKNCKYCKN
jgi:hypothetical protein